MKTTLLKLFLIGIGIAAVLSCGSGGSYKSNKVVDEPNEAEMIPVVGEAVKIAGKAVKEAANNENEKEDSNDVINSNPKPIPLKLPVNPNLIKPIKPNFEQIRKRIEKNNQFNKQYKAPAINSIISFVDNRGIGHEGKLIELLNDRLKIQIDNTKFTYQIKQIKPIYAIHFFSKLFVQNKIDQAVKVQENLYTIKRRKYYSALNVYENEYNRIKKANRDALDKWYDDAVELKKAEELAKKYSYAEKLFSGWDGSLYALKSYTKKNCKDPSSFDHIQTSFAKRPTHMIVMMKYRAKNGFGGFSIGHITATVDYDGNLLTIIKSE